MAKPKKEETKKQTLTAKQIAFCNEYILDFNGKQAAIRSGYSENSASESACENLTKPHVKEYVELLLEKQTSTINQERARLKKRLEKIAYSEDEETALRDKIKATELLGKHLGMFIERLELSGQGGEPIEFTFVDPKEE